MPRASDRTTARRDAWLVAACVLLSVGGLFAPARTATALAAGLRRTLLLPLVVLQEDAVASRQTRARFAAVSAERDSARLAAQQLPGLKAENDNLRALLGLSRRLDRKWRAADVLHQQQPTDGRMLLVTAGARDGVAEFSPVVSAGGLIGAVRTVSPTTSLVLTWAHPDWRASGITLDGTSYGMVQASAGGSGSETGLEFHAISYRDSLPDGTLVVTAGLGGVYPQGIPLGTVAGISREQTGWERVYRLRPAANPSSATHLLVLDANAVGSMLDAFPKPVAPAPAPKSAPADTVAGRDTAARRSDSASAPVQAPAAAPSAAAGPGATPPAAKRPAGGDSAARPPRRRRADSTQAVPATPPSAEAPPATDPAPPATPDSTR